VRIYSKEKKNYLKIYIYMDGKKEKKEERKMRKWILWLVVMCMMIILMTGGIGGSSKYIPAKGELDKSFGEGGIVVAHNAAEG